MNPAFHDYSLEPKIMKCRDLLYLCILRIFLYFNLKSLLDTLRSMTFTLNLNVQLLNSIPSWYLKNKPNFSTPVKTLAERH